MTCGGQRAGGTATRLVAAAVAVCLVAVHGVGRAAAGPQGVIDLRDGGHLPGGLAPAAEVDGGRDTVFWQAPAFLAPFEFRLDEVAGMRFDPGRAAAAAEPADDRGLRLHLRGGDVIAGELRAVDADTITFAAPLGPGTQTVQIDRRQVESLARRSAGGSGFDGPGGLAGWKQVPDGSWREEAGRLLTVRPGAAVARDVAAPPRARFDIRLSWSQGTEFRFAAGSAEDEGADGFWVELLRPRGGPPKLAVVRREGAQAKLESLAVDDRGDSLRIVLFVDQLAGRMAAVLPGANDAPAADLALPRRAAARPSARVRLALSAGEVCLESLRVTPWTAAEPTLDEADGTVIVFRGGMLSDAEVAGFDAESGELVVRAGGETKRLPLDDLEKVSFPRPAGPPPDQPQLRAVSGRGDVVSGRLVKVDDQAVWIRRPGADQPIGMPFTDLVAVQSLRAAATPRELPGREGRLEGEGFAMRGCLVGVAGGVGWQPVGAAAAVRFAAAGGVPFAGRLDYVASLPEPDAFEGVGGIGGMVNRTDDGAFVVTMLAEDGAAAQDGRLQPGDRIVAISPTERARFVPTQRLEAEQATDLLRGRVGVVVRLKVTDAQGENPREIDLVRGRLAVAGTQLLRQALETHAELAAPQSAGESEPYPSLLVLVSGESTVCRIESIDADRVRLTAPLAAGGAEAVDVPARLVKAVELDAASPSRNLDKVRFERLLTIPRMQRPRPPTHLVRTKTGDYVRGRLTQVDEATVRIELPGSEQVLPRDAVARVIWLHPEELDAAAAAGEADAATAGLPVLGIWPGGRRVGLDATGMEGAMVEGRSPAFGPIRIDTGAVDRLLFGKAIAADTAPRPYSQWKVRPAPEPRALREAAQGEDASAD